MPPIEDSEEIEASSDSMTINDDEEEKRKETTSQVAQAKLL